MKISKKDFDQMQKKYDQEIQKGKPARGPKQDVDNQTKSIFFDRQTIEEVLSKADKDPHKGGIKFYFTEYTEEVARKLYPENPEDYIGRLGIVMSPSSSVNENLDQDEEEYYNRGNYCPPKCE
jgi:hypothetical protein